MRFNFSEFFPAFSDIPSSFESQSQFMNIDAKEIESIAHDQLPKDVANHAMNPASEANYPEQAAAQSIPQGTATNMYCGVSQEAIMQMQQQQQQQHQPASTPQVPAATPAPAQSEPPKDLESASPTKSQPVRKISRFLVSPAILTVTNEKNAQNICVEDPIKSPLPAVINNSTMAATQSPNFIQNMPHISPDKQFDPQNQVNLVENIRTFSIERFNVFSFDICF